jgi:hypothetical protein
MPLVDPYHDRYIDEKGNVIGVRFDGPVGDMRRSEYNLGVGGTGQVSRTGSTQQGGLEPITPPEMKDMNSSYKDIFQQLFMKALAEDEEREKERRQ